MANNTDVNSQIEAVKAELVRLMNKYDRNYTLRADFSDMFQKLQMVQITLNQGGANGSPLFDFGEEAEYKAWKATNVSPLPNQYGDYPADNQWNEVPPSEY